MIPAIKSETFFPAFWHDSVGRDSLKKWVSDGFSRQDARVLSFSAGPESPQNEQSAKAVFERPGRKLYVGGRRKKADPLIEMNKSVRGRGKDRFDGAHAWFTVGCSRG